jgi:hypothetical protein
MDLALTEMHRLKHDLGFAGVEIGSNINGRAIGAPEFDPFCTATPTASSHCQPLLGLRETASHD